MVLYNYLGTHGLTFLSNLELKLSNPAEVDDPFEMWPCAGSSEVSSEMVDRLLDNRERMAVFFPSTGWSNLDAWIAHCRENREELRRWLSGKLAEAFKRYCDNAPQEVAKGYRMLCLSELRDSILMWSHYADKHHGIAVGFDRDGLARALEARPLEVRCGEDTRRTVFDAEQFLFPKLEYAEQLLTRKSRDWSYQKEVRFVVLYRGKLFFECPPTLIRCVCLGCKFPPEEIPCVRKLMKRNNIKAELLKGIPDENYFRINFQPI